ncbi:MAG: glycine cleavage system protein GcvH [Methylophilaceae bacterium]
MNTNIRYSEYHLWTRPDADDIYLVGISDHAQNMLGDIVFVQAPAIGAKLQAGEVCGFVESVKTASDLHAPLSGEVVEINGTLNDTPDQLNEAAEETWIFRLKADDAFEFSALMDDDAYHESL